MSDVTITDVTTRSFCLGLWGPRARDILQRVSADDVSDAAIPYMTAPRSTSARCRRSRSGSATSASWATSCYGPIEMGARLWDTLWAAGRDDGLIAAGLGAFDSLRLEKGYRLWGQDIDTEHDPFEAGLGFAVRMDKDVPGARGARGDPRRAAPQRSSCR